MIWLLVLIAVAIIFGAFRWFVVWLSIMIRPNVFLVFLIVLFFPSVTFLSSKFHQCIPQHRSRCCISRRTKKSITAILRSLVTWDKYTTCLRRRSCQHSCNRHDVHDSGGWTSIPQHISIAQVEMQICKVAARDSRYGRRSQLNDCV